MSPDPLCMGGVWGQDYTWWTLMWQLELVVPPLDKQPLWGFLSVPCTLSAWVGSGDKTTHGEHWCGSWSWLFPHWTNNLYGDSSLSHVWCWGGNINLLIIFMSCLKWDTGPSSSVSISAMWPCVIFIVGTNLSGGGNVMNISLAPEALCCLLLSPQ